MSQERQWMVIAGSMKASPAMIQYAVDVTKRAIEKGYHIVVGDNPNGVDFAVIVTIGRQHYKHFSVVHPEWYNRAFIKLQTGKTPQNKHSRQDYHERDKLMCDMADTGMFIWDGKSKGTKAGFDYMVSTGRVVHLADFTSGIASVLSMNVTNNKKEYNEPMKQQRLW